MLRLREVELVRRSWWVDWMDDFLATFKLLAILRRITLGRLEVILSFG